MANSFPDDATPNQDEWWNKPEPDSEDQPSQDEEIEPAQDEIFDLSNDWEETVTEPEQPNPFPDEDTDTSQTLPFVANLNEDAAKTPDTNDDFSDLIETNTPPAGSQPDFSIFPPTNDPEATNAWAQPEAADNDDDAMSLGDEILIQEGASGIISGTALNDPDAADLFLDEESLSEFDLAGNSGINIGDQPTGIDESNQPPSSIFAQDIPHNPSQVNLDEIPQMASNDEMTDAILMDSQQGGSSIFPRTDPEMNLQDDDVLDLTDRDDIDAAEGAVDWNQNQDSSDTQPSRIEVPTDWLDEPDIAHSVDDESHFSGSHESLAYSPELDEVEDLVEQPSSPTFAKPRVPSAAMLAEDLDEEEPIRPRRESAKSSSNRGWIGGGVMGLGAAAIAAAGLYFGGVVDLASDSQVTSREKNTQATNPVGVPAPANPLQPLAAATALEMVNRGDHEAVLKATESLENPPTPLLAARGQARWLLRASTLAKSNATVEADDEELLAASSDLNKVLQQTTDPQTAEEKQAVVKATLHLGLIKELSGDLPAARARYQDGYNLYPFARPIFDAALDRIKVLPAPAEKVSQRIQPEQMDLLLAIPLLVMLQAEEAKADEPAVYYWQAVNQAATGKYTEATATIAKARELHETLRKQFLAQGINANSDPLQQVFLRTCDDLKEFYSLKAALYGHPTVGPMMIKEGAAKTLDQLSSAQSAATKLMGELAVAKLELETQKETLSENMKLLDQTKMTNVLQAVELTKIKTSLMTSSATVMSLNKEITQLQTQLKTYQADSVTMKEQVTQLETELNTVVTQFKTNKWIAADATTADALKAIPDVLKTLSTSSNSADAKKAAEMIRDLRKQLEKSSTDYAQLTTAMTAAKTELAAMKKQSDDMLASLKADQAVQLEKLQKTYAEDLAKKIADVKLNGSKELEAMQNQLKTLELAQANAKQELEARLAAQANAHAQEMMIAKSGVTVTLTPEEVRIKENAMKIFDEAVQAYFRGEYSDAEKGVQAAIKLNPSDARYWYYLGLCHFAFGRSEEAEAAYTKAANYESQNLPPTREVGTALERIQGSARNILDRFRP